MKRSNDLETRFYSALAFVLVVAAIALSIRATLLWWLAQ